MPKKSKLLELLYKEAKDSTKEKKNKKKRYNAKIIERIEKPRKCDPSDKIITTTPVSKPFSIMVKERDTPGHHIYVNYKDSIMNKSRPSPLPFLPESYVTDHLNPQQEYRLYKPFNPTTTSRVGGKSKKSKKSKK
jgi:hypothetical protein